MKDLFNPEQDANKETQEVVRDLGFESAVSFQADMRDKTKATAGTLISLDGEFCWGKSSEEEKDARRGGKLGNDAAEYVFA